MTEAAPEALRAHRTRSLCWLRSRGVRPVARLWLLTAAMLCSCATATPETDDRSVVAPPSLNAGPMNGADGGNAGGRVGPRDMGARDGADGIEVDGRATPERPDLGTAPGVERLVGRASTASCHASPPSEDVTRLVDGDAHTKFLAVTSSAWAVFDAGAPYVLSHYALVSANDAPERDPVRWLLQGSNDAQVWDDLDVQVARRFVDRFERQEYAVAPRGFHRWYRLRMENATGTQLQVAELELFGTTVFTTPAAAAPSAPGSLRAEPVGRTRVALEWTDRSDDEVVFRVERSDDGTRFEVVGLVPADVTRFTVVGLEPGGRAAYRVVAENAAGSSPPSEVLEAAPLSALVGRPDGDGLVYTDAGYALTVIDEAPDVTPRAFISRMVEEFFAAYPPMVADYNVAAPRAVTVHFDPDYDGVAEAGGRYIRISASYVAGNPRDIDLIIHEAFHLVQAYRFEGSPGWAVEGLADFVRCARPHGQEVERGGRKLPLARGDHERRPGRSGVVAAKGPGAADQVQHVARCGVADQRAPGRVGSELRTTERASTILAAIDLEGRGITADARREDQLVGALWVL